ncbi:hypothetical protein B6N60_00816 [Richelia sinica FACHB-800]|uniref:Uncharacterized protein n=1 Tax=Richelia sinica FACHB-800 TaxID=1357546 RepID=A0A975T4W7_9NOST|nr:hypothetical protein B6N60_00816 [Richelia sinica FACHB-800]
MDKRYLQDFGFSAAILPLLVAINFLCHISPISCATRKTITDRLV